MPLPKETRVSNTNTYTQVVLTDGTIVNATPTQNADLYKALKGGLNNFGRYILDIPIMEIMELTDTFKVLLQTSTS